MEAVIVSIKGHLTGYIIGLISTVEGKLCEHQITVSEREAESFRINQKVEVIIQ